MQDFMQSLIAWLEQVNSVLWHDYVLYVLLAVGVLFTVWSGFSQYRALTHGVQVIRGKYDRKEDPGAINHFQALSTALSATVGLGNIAGVAIAVSLGGPGAIFWMWVTGFIGMALKLTEVTQAMLFRDTSDPNNPHGGAMWVCKKGFAQISPVLAPLGTIVGGIFCITLLVSTVTGGNMFQAWNVADISYAYFGIPQIVTGIVLALLVGMVIVGGIKRIGDVAARIVPFMCALYLLAGLVVIVMNAGRIPEMFALIFREAFAPSEAVGAFLGGTAGYGFLKGMQRALFSNEAGQGSAPIAHSAAKTDQPVREGVVAGLEPFVDTVVVCTITALVILLSGTWNREPPLRFVDGRPAVVAVGTDPQGRTRWQIPDTRVRLVNEVEVRGQLPAEARPGQPAPTSSVFVVVKGAVNPVTGGTHHRIVGSLSQRNGELWVSWDARSSDEQRSGLPPYAFAWSEGTPEIATDGVYVEFKGATLTAKAFDRVIPGVGLWIVPAVAWLFAFSTMISWSYYGEQAIVYLLGLRAVMPYRVIYCLLVLLATAGLIQTEHQLDVVSTLGVGFMLWANIPIMLIFGPVAMRAYHDYMRRLKAGEFKGHEYPPITDVVEGRDVE